MLKVLNDKRICKSEIRINYFLKIGMLLLALVLLIPGTLAVDVNSSNKIVAPGQSFDLNVSIDPLGTPIAGAQLNFAFNKSILKINSVTEGNLFNQNGAITFFSGGNINNSAGTVINIFNAIIGKYNVTTRGTFIIINITATGSTGISGINLSNVKISDPSGYPVTFNMTNATVRINSPPVLTAIGNKTVNEGQALNFTLSAVDPDGKTSVTQNSTIYINNVYPRYDVNENGIVDIGDLVTIGQHFNENTGIQYPRYDVNKDSVVDIADITITAQHFGEHT